LIALKIIKYLILIIFLAIAILLIAPKFISWDSYKEKIIDEFKKQTKLELIVAGPIKVILFPKFKIIASDVSILNNKESTNPYLIKNSYLIIQFGLLDLLGSDIKLNNITIKNSLVSLEEYANGTQNFDFIFNDKSNSTNSVSFDNCNFEYIKNKNYILNNISNAYLSISSKDKKFTLRGNLPINDENLILNANWSNDDKSIIIGDISASSFKINFSGNLNQQENLNILKGKLTANINNFNSFAVNYLSNITNAAQKIESTEAASITTDFIISSKQANFDNLIFKSSSIEAKGKIDNLYNDISDYNIDLSFDKLDLDRLSIKDQGANKNKDHVLEQEAIQKLMQNINDKKNNLDLNLASNIKLTVKLDINNFKLLNKSFKNAKIYSELNQGIMQLHPSAFVIDDDMQINFSGLIKSNQVRPIFEGKVNLVGKDFTNFIRWSGYNEYLDENVKAEKFIIDAKLIATPKQLALYDIESKFNNLDLAGSFTIHLTKDSPKIRAELGVNELNLDQYINLQKLNKSVENLQTNNNFLANLNWLRSIPYEMNLSYNFNNLTINNQLINSLSGSMYVLPGMIKIESTNIDSDFADFVTDATIDIRAIKPELNINIKGEKYDSNFINFSADDKTTDINKIWSAQKFKFFKLNNFNGLINVSLDNYKLNNLDLKKINFNGTLSENIVNINNFEGKVFNGRFFSKGTFINDPLSLSISFALENLSAHEFVKYYTFVDSIDGYISVSGSFGTQGNSPVEWAAKSNANLSFAGRKISINNFDLEKIIKMVENKDTNVKSIYDQNIKTFLNSGKTTFDSIDGNLSIINGILQTNQLTHNTYRTNGNFAGSLDLNNMLNSSATNFSFIPQIGENPITFAINFSGPITLLEKKIDDKQILDYLQIPHN
jgi:uncharacterized protein involved in outer membrane biogenesis